MTHKFDKTFSIYDSFYKSEYFWLSRNTLRQLLSDESHQSEYRIDSTDAENTEDAPGTCEATAGHVQVPDLDEAIYIHESEVIGGDSDIIENSSSESSVSDNDPHDSDESDDDNSDISRATVVSNSARSVASSVEEDSDSGSANISFLCEGSDMQSNEALYEVLKLYVDEKWTKTSLDKNVKLIRRMLPKPNDMPSDGRDALTRLETMTASFKEDVHFYCVKCMGLCDVKSGKVCGACGSDDQLSTFYTFPIEDQIKFFFEQRDMATLLENYTHQQQRKEGLICDIQDGTEYKRIKAHLTGKHDLIILWNADVVASSGSSKQELWPILGTICELPPRVRSFFMIVCGVVVCIGKVTIDMNLYLKSFVDDLIRINNNGGIA